MEAQRYEERLGCVKDGSTSQDGLGKDAGAVSPTTVYAITHIQASPHPRRLQHYTATWLPAANVRMVAKQGNDVDALYASPLATVSSLRVLATRLGTLLLDLRYSTSKSQPESLPHHVNELHSRHWYFRRASPSKRNSESKPESDTPPGMYVFSASVHDRRSSADLWSDCLRLRQSCV